MWARAILIAFSTASAPEFRKNVFFGKVPGVSCVHTLGQLHVALVRRDLDAGMQKSSELRLDRGDHRLSAMADVQAADAAGEIEIAIAVHVFEPCILCAGDEHRGRLRDAARDGRFAAGGERTRIRSRHRRFQLDRAHVDILQ